MRPLLIAMAFLLAVGAGAAAWDGDAARGDGGGRLLVVATTSQAADLARLAGGSRVRVRGLLAANTDPHGYEVRPRDVRDLARAGLVVRSGGDLDAWLQEALEAAGAGPREVALIDHVRTLREDGEVDPHWWQDPRNAQRAVRALRSALTRVDPQGAGAYRASARRALARLAALDARVAACLRRVPPARRDLVTTHDALGYYARRYGLRVVGTVIPSLSTAGQPSAGAVSGLVATLRASGARAVFAEQAVHPRVEAAIAREAGARVGRPLFTDALGPAGSPGATYVGSIEANTRAIAEGLTGSRVSCP